MSHSALILASGSPRRRELLAEAGYQFEVIPPAEDVECGVCSEAGPAGLVAELAFRKAAAVVRQLHREQGRGRGSFATGDHRHLADFPVAKDSRPLSALQSQKTPDPVDSRPRIVVAADTVAECDGMILGKPRDEADARTMLQQLSGREHRVLTGLCLWRLGDQEPLVRVAVTRLKMDTLTEEQLDDYLASHQWEGKAGAFGYQDRLGWVHIVEGSESNVVGLPMELLAELLAQFDSGE